MQCSSELVTGRTSPGKARWHGSGWIALWIVLLPVAGHASASEFERAHSLSGIERIVAIGDLHGDWDGYIATLRAAGLVDERGRWRGGDTHLVQTGDIPSRGPDTRRIIEHMARLATQAERAGGQVHNLMGNHEAMNVFGDLRYVTSGEYADWADRRSGRLRDRYFEQILARMKRDDPERFEALPDDFEASWKAEHPEGWVEHRQAWSPLWNEQGKMYQWVRDQRVAVRINRFVFLHGGISAAYCTSSLASWTERAREALDGRTDDELDILVDPVGPLWYRGLSGVAPVASPSTVEAILQRYDVDHIVVGHTPTGGAIWPRYDGRVIQIDTGIALYYGGYVAYLEITPEGRFAGYRAGKVRLPDNSEGLDEYIAAVLALHPGDSILAQRMAELNRSLIPAGESSEPQPASDRISCGMPQ
ncbi:MAG: metallophosphoesterase [Wenzhouxiangella sp.]|jgi:hypothetical protein|nr:metallophosphoesterase [Wenzhouxiangella sp.]